MPKIDNNKRALIAHMLGQGLGPTKIAKEVDCSVRSVNRIAKQLDIKQWLRAAVNTPNIERIVMSENE